MNIDEKMLEESFKELNLKTNNLNDYPRELINEFLIVYYQFNRTTDQIGSQGVMGIFNQAFFDSGNIESALEETSKNTAVIMEKRKSVDLLLNTLEELRKTEPKNFLYACNVAIDSFKYGIKRASKKPKITRDIERFFKKLYIKEKPNLLTAIS